MPIKLNRKTVQRTSSGQFVPPKTKFIRAVEAQKLLLQDDSKSGRRWFKPTIMGYEVDIKYGNMTLLEPGQVYPAKDKNEVLAILDEALEAAKRGEFDADINKAAVEISNRLAGKKGGGRKKRQAIVS